MTDRRLVAGAAGLCAVLLAGCAAGVDDSGAAGPSAGSPGGTAAPGVRTRPSPDQAAGARIEGVRTQEYQAPEHVARDLSYDARPPLQGSHWPPQAGGVLGWLRCGVYTEPLPEEFALHSLEHGAVWFTYLPGSDGDLVDALTALASDRPEYALVSPYEDQRGPVVATAWGAQLVVQDARDPRLAQFLTAYAGGDQGREQGADCANGTPPAAARAALAAAGP